MTEAAESGERAARAALDDAMSLNVLRVLDTLYSAGLIASPGTPGPMAADGQGCGAGVQPRELWRRGTAGHIFGASRRVRVRLVASLGMHAAGASLSLPVARASRHDHGGS